MRYAWLTDIHLNFLDKEERELFYKKILDTDCDGVLISGDIGEAKSVASLLEEMSKFIKMPIYFVLGNHDYYGGSVDGVKEAVSGFPKKGLNLLYLAEYPQVALTLDTMIIGQDGWADGRLGDYENSNVLMNDSRVIADLFQASCLDSIYSKNHLLKKMQELADGDASKIEQSIKKLSHIPTSLERIIILTHVPAFKEASLYRGKISDDDHLPFYSSDVMGEVLKIAANKFPNIDFLVLSGHTHGKAEYKPLDNLTVKVGHAEYYSPEIQEIITV